MAYSKVYQEKFDDVDQWYIKQFAMKLIDEKGYFGAESIATRLYDESIEDPYWASWFYAVYLQIRSLYRNFYKG